MRALARGVLVFALAVGVAAGCGGTSDEPDGPPVIDSFRADGGSEPDGPLPDGYVPPDGAVPDGAAPFPDGYVPPPDGVVPPPDAFVAPPPDAFIPPPPPDAFVPPPPDATPPPPDAAPAPIVVTVYNQSGGRAGGVPVIFSNPDGSVFSTRTTARGGTVTETMPGGGSVTAVITLGTFRWLSTVLDVQPGDSIELGNPNGQPTPSSVGTISIAIPGTGATGRTFEGTIGCTSGTFASVRIPLALDVTTACPTEPDALGMGVDSAGTGDVTHYFFQKRVPLVGGAATVTGADWRTDVTNATLSVTNAPLGTTSVRAVSSAHAQTFGRVIATRVLALSAGGAGSFVLPMLNDYPEVVEHQVTSIPALGSSSIRYRAASMPATRSVNLGTELLPVPTAPTVTGGIVAFSWSGGAGTPDGGLVSLLYTNPTEARGFWSFIAPPGLTTFTLPTIPDGLIDDAPAAGAVWASAAQLTDYSGYAGWDAMRTASMRLVTTSGIGAFTSGFLKQSTSN